MCRLVPAGVSFRMESKVNKCKEPVNEIRSYKVLLCLNSSHCSTFLATYGVTFAVCRTAQNVGWAIICITTFFVVIFLYDPITFSLLVYMVLNFQSLYHKINIITTYYYIFHLCLSGYLNAVYRRSMPQIIHPLYTLFLRTPNLIVIMFLFDSHVASLNLTF